MKYKMLIFAFSFLLICQSSFGADIWLRSGDGDNASDGSTWNLAKKTLEDGGMSSTGDGALTAAGAGGRVFMSDNHAQTESTFVLVEAGTINAPILILSVDDSGDQDSTTPPTTLLAGGSVATTTNNVVNLRGYLYFHGVTFAPNGNLRISGGDTKVTIEECIVNHTGTSEILIGSINHTVSTLFLNTSITFGNVAASISVEQAGRFLMSGGSIAATGSIPTALFDELTVGGITKLTDVDLSQINTNLIDPTNIKGIFELSLERCSLASLTILQNAIPHTGTIVVRLHSCSSDNTTHGLTEERYEGTVTDEIVIFRTAGSTDGTTPFSVQMTTVGNSIETLQPLVSPPIVSWTDSTSSTNFDIEILIDSATTLNNDDVWMELESPGSDAQGVLTSTRVALLSTPTELTTSTEAWTGETTEKTYRLRVTVTPGKVGPVTARVYLAKPNTTIFVDSIITEN